MKRAIFLLFICSLCGHIAYSNGPVDSKIYAEIKQQKFDSANPDPDPFAYTMNITTSLNFNVDPAADSLLLTVEYPVNFPVKGLGISLKDVLTEHGDSLEFTYDGSKLVMQLKKDVRSYRINYSVYVPNIFANSMNIENFFIAEFYIQDQRSWFFTSSNMKISSLIVQTPPNSYFVTAGESKKKHRQYSLNIDRIQNFNMAILAKRSYKQVKGQSGGVKYRLWLHNFSDSLLYDSTKKAKYWIDYLTPARPLTRKDISVKKTIIEKYLQLTTEIYGSSNVEKNIIECYWNTGKASGGRCLSDRLIIADSTFIMNGGMLHELLHSFDPIDYKACCSDSSRFLFSESMIEYLTRYLLRKDGTIKSKEFSLNDPFFEGRPRVPIFEITENNQDSQYTIYAYVPWVLSNFAKEIGEERFIRIYQQFHMDCIANHEVRFDNFIKVLKQFSIPTQSIESLIAQLYTIK